MPSLTEILNREPAQPAPPPQPFSSQPQPGIIREGWQGARKLLIVLPFWDGDHEPMAELCRLIADIEPTLNRQADVMLYCRNDAQIMEEDVRLALASRFGKVQVHRCRRRGTFGYPYGPNEMFYDLIEFFRQPKWRQEYFAFLNMEYDCVPLTTDWIARLIEEFRRVTADEAHFAMGHIHGGITGDGRNNGPMHLNGAAMYAMDIWDRAGAMTIIGGNPRIAYDFEHAPKFLPISVNTPLMHFKWRHTTTTPEELFGLEKEGQKPVFYHGVKDGSARAAVRRVLVEKLPIADASGIVPEPPQ